MCILQAFLSREDCNPNITGKASQTPLHIAAKMDKVSICKVLVSGKLGILGLLYKYLPKMSIASCSLRKQASHISQRHHCFPCEGTSEGRTQKCILVTCYLPNMGSASKWSFRKENFPPQIRSTTHIWVVTRVSDGISSLVPQNVVALQLLSQVG